MKSKEELKQLKQEVETLNEKLTELTEDELQQVSAGISSEELYQSYIGRQLTNTPQKCACGNNCGTILAIWDVGPWQLRFKVKCSSCGNTYET